LFLMYRLVAVQRLFVFFRIAIADKILGGQRVVDKCN
jgi:hypothetical protein